MKSHEERVRELMTEFSTAMLVTNSSQGFHGRPMAIVSVDSSCLSFFTAFDSPKVDEILKDPSVLVILQEDRSLCISVNGTALLSRDKARIAGKWKESFKTWFPDGVDDPTLTLIDVYPSRIEYWDNSGLNKVKYLIEAAKAYVSGEKPKVPEEVHGVLKT
jgi:general stress protein 26